MGLFDNMLGANESLIRNETALDPEFVPKLVPFRDQHQRKLAACIAPMEQCRNGRNAFITGQPGIGKTAAARWVLRELEEKSDEIYPVYVNCWQKNTTFQILVDICHQLGYSFTQNKRTDELLEVVKGLVNKKSAVFVFDEVDKATDLDFLYSLLTDIYRRSLVLITNYKEWFDDLEERVKSRLLPEMLEFQPYTAHETAEILKQRVALAFPPNVWQDDALKAVAGKAAEAKDVRVGLFLLREAASAAESKASRVITAEHAQLAVSKADQFKIKQSTDLEEDTKMVLDIVKEHSGERIGDMHKLYLKKGGQGTYKTFARKIERLEKGQFIVLEKQFGGKDGNTTIVKYAKEKKLSEY